MIFSVYEAHHPVAVCAGCGLEIESWDEALLFKGNGKRFCIHNEFDCLKEAVGAIPPAEEAENYLETWERD